MNVHFIKSIKLDINNFFDLYDEGHISQQQNSDIHLHK